MTDDPLATARRVCTPKQIEALELINQGYGPRRIARILGISKQAVNDRIENARRKIKAEQEEQG